MKKFKLPVALATICSAVVLMTSMMLPASKVLLRLDPTEGITYTNTIISDIAMKVMGQDMSIYSEMTMENEITKVSNGTIATNYKLTHLTNKMNIPGMPAVAYDSNNTSPEGMMEKQLAGVYGLLVNKDFPMEVSNRGEVIKSPDFSELVANAPQVGEINESMKNLYVKFPEKEMGVGEFWAEDTTIEGQVPMNIKTKYTIKDINSKNIVIEMTGSISPVENNTTIDGSLSGILNYDRKSCWLISGTTSMDTKVTISMQGQTQSFDMKVSAVIK